VINARVSKKSDDLLVSLCDNELIGREVNNSVISEDFYGEVLSEDEIIELLSEATVINALGEDSVALVEEVKGDLNKVMIDGLVHVEWFLLKQ